MDRAIAREYRQRHPRQDHCDERADDRRVRRDAELHDQLHADDRAEYRQHDDQDQRRRGEGRRMPSLSGRRWCRCLRNEIRPIRLAHVRGLPKVRSRCAILLDPPSVRPDALSRRSTFFTRGTARSITRPVADRRLCRERALACKTAVNLSWLGHPLAGCVSEWRLRVEPRDWIDPAARSGVGAIEPSRVASLSAYCCPFSVIASILFQPGRRFPLLQKLFARYASHVFGTQRIYKPPIFPFGRKTKLGSGHHPRPHEGRTA
jgi:hypothetical protein